MTMRENNTLDWYRENAEEFIANTGKVDMTALFSAFLDMVPSGGYVMDLGCGGGSASLYFTQAGYRVLAVDGCRELCEHTGTGSAVKHGSFVLTSWIIRIPLTGSGPAPHCCMCGKPNCPACSAWSGRL